MRLDQHHQQPRQLNKASEKKPEKEHEKTADKAANKGPASASTGRADAAAIAGKEYAALRNAHRAQALAALEGRGKSRPRAPLGKQNATAVTATLPPPKSHWSTDSSLGHGSGAASSVQHQFVGKQAGAQLHRAPSAQTTGSSGASSTNSAAAAQVLQAQVVRGAQANRMGSRWSSDSSGEDRTILAVAPRQVLPTSLPLPAVLPARGRLARARNSINLGQPAPRSAKGKRRVEGEASDAQEQLELAFSNYSGSGSGSGSSHGGDDDDKA